MFFATIKESLLLLHLISLAQGVAMSSNKRATFSIDDDGGMVIPGELDPAVIERGRAIPPDFTQTDWSVLVWGDVPQQIDAASEIRFFEDEEDIHSRRAG